MMLLIKVYDAEKKLSEAIGLVAVNSRWSRQKRIKGSETIPVAC
jgi:hypothetical protein